MAAFSVQISVASSTVSYLKMLFEAGAISVNAQSNEITIDPTVMDHIKAMHHDLAGGDKDLETKLNTSFDEAMLETNELVTGKGLVAYP